MSPLEADAWFTIGVSAWLVLAGGLALAALPWSDDELRAFRAGRWLRPLPARPAPTLRPNPTNVRRSPVM